MTDIVQTPLLQVSVVRAGDTVVLRLEGELDCATAPQVDAAVAEVLGRARPPRSIVVDADRLAFVDGSGVGALLRIRQQLPPCADLRVRNAHRQVVRVIQLLDLGDQLRLEIDIDLDR